MVGERANEIESQPSRDRERERVRIYRFYVHAPSASSICLVSSTTRHLHRVPERTREREAKTNQRDTQEARERETERAAASCEDCFVCELPWREDGEKLHERTEGFAGRERDLLVSKISERLDALGEEGALKHVDHEGRVMVGIEPVPAAVTRPAVVVKQDLPHRREGKNTSEENERATYKHTASHARRTKDGQKEREVHLETYLFL